MFIYWEPFPDFYGQEVSYEDIVNKPLQPDETLRANPFGRCCRLRVPSDHSTFSEVINFWVQIHLNKWGHLQAINKLIKEFQEEFFLEATFDVKKIQEFYRKSIGLRSLKNDYGFTSLHLGSAEWIEKELVKGESAASLLFYECYQKMIEGEEKNRQREFNEFLEECQKTVDLLSLNSKNGLRVVRFFSVLSQDNLITAFNQEVDSLCDRLNLIEKTFESIAEIRKVYRGKFTISSAENQFLHLENCLKGQLEKVGMEIILFIEHLIVNYRISPSKKFIVPLLASLQFRSSDLLIDEKGIHFIFGSISEGVSVFRRILKVT